jgi:hypothetical protein
MCVYAVWQISLLKFALCMVCKPLKNRVFERVTKARAYDGFQVLLQLRECLLEALLVVKGVVFVGFAPL